MKIAIVGNCGSGKSTLARKIYKLLGVPLYHLDQYFWKPGWQRPELEEFAQIHTQLCDKPEWIIEGMAVRHFAYRAERADIIVFLDMPRWLCLFRILKRTIQGFGHVGKSSAKGCPERVPSREFLSYTWNFNRTKKTVIQTALEKYKNQKKIFVIRNNAAIPIVLQQLSEL